MGHWVPTELLKENVAGTVKFQDSKPVLMARVDKKTAGRILDGQLGTAFRA